MLVHVNRISYVSGAKETAGDLKENELAPLEQIMELWKDLSPALREQALKALSE
jgi:hypothetical protein